MKKTSKGKKKKVILPSKGCRCFYTIGRPAMVPEQLQKEMKKEFKNDYKNPNLNS